jgi:hypothetical protein
VSDCDFCENWHSESCTLFLCLFSSLREILYKKSAHNVEHLCAFMEIGRGWPYLGAVYYIMCTALATLLSLRTFEQLNRGLNGMFSAFCHAF